MDKEQHEQLKEALKRETFNGNAPLTGKSVTTILKGTMGYLYNAPSMSQDIADIANVLLEVKLATHE